MTNEVGTNTTDVVGYVETNQPYVKMFRAHLVEVEGIVVDSSMERNRRVSSCRYVVNRVPRAT